MSIGLWFPHERWMRQARCAGLPSHLFFPQWGDPTAEAKAVCWGANGQSACPVREQCLDYALANYVKHGIWGGLSEKERRTVRKVRAVRTRQAS